MAATQASFDVPMPISFGGAVRVIRGLIWTMLTTHPVGGSLFLLMVLAGVLVWLNEPVKRSRR